MKKLFPTVLALCLCLIGAAAAESPAEFDVAVSFDGVPIEVSSSAIGFLIPSDFTTAEITPEEAAQGLLVNAASADGSYTLQVTLTLTGRDELLQGLQAAGTQVQEYMVNGVDYLSYTAAATQTGVVFLGENSDQALTFAFTIPQGVDAGQTPLEIMGSLYEL